MAAQGEAPEGRTGLLKPYHGTADLLAVTQTRDPRLEGAKPAEIKLALGVAAHTLRASRAPSKLETRRRSRPHRGRIPVRRSPSNN
jgi:hypothetical protein